MPARAFLAVLLLPLLLGGCYVSKTALITPATADYPLPDGTRLVAFRPAGTTWRPQPARTLKRIGERYVYVEDGLPRPSVPFLLKRIGKNRFVAQIADTSNPSRVTEYYYALFDFDGTTAVQYKPNCTARPDFVARKLADRIEETAERRCVFSDLAKLVTVLTEDARNAAPEAKFVIAKP